MLVTVLLSGSKPVPCRSTVASILISAMWDTLGSSLADATVVSWHRRGVCCLVLNSRIACQSYCCRAKDLHWAVNWSQPISTLVAMRHQCIRMKQHLCQSAYTRGCLIHDMMRNPQHLFLSSKRCVCATKQGFLLSKHPAPSSNGSAAIHCYRIRP